MTFTPDPSTCLFLTLAGSQAHGTARDGSDVDLRGVCAVPLGERLSLLRSFEQHEGALSGDLDALVRPKLEAHPTAGRALEVKLESVIYDVAKLLQLCVQANPNALEILFADPADHVHLTPRGERLLASRAWFVTQKVQHTFMGYALAQLRRIQTHRAWLLSPPERQPTREDFGLPEGPTLNRDDQNRIEGSLAAAMRRYKLDELEMPPDLRIALNERLEQLFRDQHGESDEGLRSVAARQLGLPSEILETLNAERRYRGALKRWDAYRSWKKHRNPARAALEAKHGYDTKHAAHLIRLMRVGVEALEEGVIRVRRPDAEELQAIRDGALGYDDLLDEAQGLKERMETAAKTTTLPKDVDREAVDRLALELMLPG